jgi:hypothetical protein
MLETNLESDSPSFTEEQLVSAGFSRDKTLELLREDLNFFAGAMIPEVFTLMFPDIHQQIWKLLREFVSKPGIFPKIALGLPRGHAKTTLIKLFVTYCVLFTNRKFVLLVGANADKGENILTDVMTQLKSPNVVAIFGNWQSTLSKETGALKRFHFKGREVILAALGPHGSIRGLNVGNARPDVIIMDDIQSAEDKDSKDVADKLLVWLLGTLFLAKSPTGCVYIYIGNMFSGPNCILAKFKKSKEWVSFVVGALLANGSSIWPELHPPEALIGDLQHSVDMGHPEVWFAEVQNDPDSGISSNFDINKVPENPYLDSDMKLAHCIIIDLSGQKKGSDDTTIGYFMQVDDKWVYRDLTVGIYSPLQCIEAAIDMGWLYNCPYIFVESVAYQASYLFWFNHLCTQREITGFQLNEIYPGSNSKPTRIGSFLKQLITGPDGELPDIYLHSNVRTHVLYQATQFKPSRRDNKDDILDLGSLLNNVVSKWGQFLITDVQDILDNLTNSHQTIEDCCSV